MIHIVLATFGLAAVWFQWRTICLRRENARLRARLAEIEPIIARLNRRHSDGTLAWKNINEAIEMAEKAGMDPVEYARTLSPAGPIWVRPHDMKWDKI